jgi:hypothetical protein
MINEKKKNSMKNLLLIFVSIVCLGGCAQMNDKHDEFLARGETVYIGKVDSVVAFPGKGRLMFKYWISDPRAKNVTLYWGTENAYSKVLTIEEHLPADALETLLTESDGITENTYTFHWISSDQHGNKSMVFESIASVYGNQYQEKLLNRRIVATDPDDDGNIGVTWAGASSDEELGIEIFYTDKGGQPVTAYYPQPGTSLTLTNVDYPHGVTYRTLYKPAPTAIDTFYTAAARMDIVKRVNVVLGKPIIASDILNDTYPASKAVDGLLGDASRWVSSAAGSEHWIEIDLQGEYSISNYKFWNGSSNNYSNNPLASFKLQAWVNGAWTDAHVSTVANSGIFSTDFPPVTTSKVRFSSPTQTRIYELEVYSIIVY